MIHFIRPSAFWLLLPVLALCVWVWRSRRLQGQWQRVCDPHLLQHLKIIDMGGMKARFLAVLLVLFGLAVFAMAGPSWQKQQVPTFDNHAPVVLMLDVSAAMLAHDVQPSRIERAKYKVIDLLKRRQGGQTALIAFTQEPFVVAPLTEDTQTITNMLQPLDPTIMPVQGRNLFKALNKAQQLLHQGGHQSGQIVLITSELGDRNVLTLAKKLTKQHITVSVLSVGTLMGGPIQGESNQLLKDTNGNVLNATLDEVGLQTLARSGNGYYVASTADNRDIDQFDNVLSHTGAVKEKKRAVLLWQDQGHWFILLLLPLFLLGFRRGGFHES